MTITETSLPGVKLIVPKRFGDDRGFFAETFSARIYAEAGIDVAFVQDNHSLSRLKGTVRGLHLQRPPHAQAKLVRCGRGRLLDVAVDIRKGSPHYGNWIACELSAENGHQLYIPAGFAHGFSTLEDDTEIVYKCSDYYAPDCDAAVRFDDPAIGVDWQVDATKAVLSPKDAAAPLLADLDNPFTYEAAR
jgi:dTDP-4-dehydrorhamnose 3,5-epimerase